MNQAVQV